ncbi:hypothetical protein GBAR_LOCUS10017, partial [Geodia barretti]
MMSGWSCYFVSCCALLYLLIQPQSTGALECLCNDCKTGVCHTEAGGACFVQVKIS